MAIRYYTAASLDGFMADPEHSLDWLIHRAADGRGPMGYDDFMADTGALVMGATTYDWLVRQTVDAPGGAQPWPYDLPTWVLRHRERQAVHRSIHFAGGPLPPVIEQARRAAGDRHVWLVGGGAIAAAAADAGLLDEVWIQYAPVSLGAGVPVLPRRLELRLDAVARNGDMACARWTVLRTG